MFNFTDYGFNFRLFIPFFFLPFYFCKDEKKANKATPSHSHDPRPNMELRHEHVLQMGKRRAQMRSETARKKKAEQEQRVIENQEEEAKRYEKEMKESDSKTKR